MARRSVDHDAPPAGYSNTVHEAHSDAADRDQPISILEAEASRAIAGQANQLAGEIEQAWTDQTLPRLAAKLGSGRPSAARVPVSPDPPPRRGVRAESRGRRGHAQTDKLCDNAVKGARQALRAAEAAAVQAEQYLLAFKAGRPA